MKLNENDRVWLPESGAQIYHPQFKAWQTRSQKFEHCDPVIVASDYYLLDALGVGAIAPDANTIEHTETPIRRFLGGEEERYCKWRDDEYLYERQPRSRRTYNESKIEARRMAERLVGANAPIFADYLIKATAGEFGHMHAKSEFVNNWCGSTPAASLVFMISEYGANDVLAWLAKRFRQGPSYWASSFGGEAWAKGVDILRWYFNGQVDEGLPFTAHLFCDRLFSMQHNTGSMMNKVGWARNNPSGWWVDDMPRYTLGAHGASDWNTLYYAASSQVQDLVDAHCAAATEILKRDVVVEAKITTYEVRDPDKCCSRYCGEAGCCCTCESKRAEWGRSELKVGDKVKIIAAAPFVSEKNSHIGEIGIIGKRFKSSYTKKQWAYKFKDYNPTDFFFHAEQLELVKDPTTNGEFKVGDKVEIIVDHPRGVSFHNSKGVIGTIKATFQVSDVKPPQWEVEGSFESKNTGIFQTTKWWFSQDEIKHYVEPVDPELEKLLAEEEEIEAKKHHEFKVGERVKVNYPGIQCHGKIGKITKILENYPNPGTTAIYISGIDNSGYFQPELLEKIAPPSKPMPDKACHCEACVKNWSEKTMDWIKCKWDFDDLTPGFTKEWYKQKWEQFNLKEIQQAYAEHRELTKPKYNPF